MAGPAWGARDYERIATRFTAWAAGEEPIRAAVVIGSRARADHPADEWADLDLLVLHTGSRRYETDARWVASIGDAWITFVEPTAAGHGAELRVLFAGGVDVDFAFLTVEEVEALLEADPRVAGTAFDRGYRVLFDRDGIVARLVAAIAPARQAADELPAETVVGVVSDFWYHAVWTAKHLRRGELWWAKLACDTHLKELLRRVLEWDAAAAGRDPWFRGRYFEEWADPAILGRLRAAFARYDDDEVWAALAVTMDLFGEVARRTARVHGLAYPSDAERHARELVEQLRATRP